MQIACTFMEWNPLRLTTSFSFSCGAWILMQVPSTQPITPGNPPLVKKPCLFWSISSSVDGHLRKFLCFCVRASETWLIIWDTDDSNNLKKASGGEKAQCYKDLHSCQVYHAQNRNHFSSFFCLVQMIKVLKELSWFDQTYLFCFFILLSVTLLEGRATDYR